MNAVDILLLALLASALIRAVVSCIKKRSAAFAAAAEGSNFIM